MQPIPVDGGRLWDSLMAMAAIGATAGGGSNRVALSREDGLARDLFRRWCDEAGLETTIDRLGNMFARREGRDASRPAVLIGSHLDTQPMGGRFDGVLGVMAALEAVRRLNEEGVATDAAIEIVNWTDEEGCRFNPAIMPSSVVAGAQPIDAVLSARDRDGVTFDAALQTIGYRGDAPPGGTRPIGAFVELHIEQGPILEAEGVPIGVVTGGFGTECFDITVTGFAAHAGTTPPAARRDALVAAADLIGRMAAIGRAHEHRRLTIGDIKIRPGARSVVPGEAWFTVDMRNPDPDDLGRMHDEVLVAIAAMSAANPGCTAGLRDVVTSPVPLFDARLVAAVRASADALGLKHRDIMGGAVHDAMSLSSYVPTAMIFVPCRNGISHNEAEFCTPEHCAAGAAVLLNTALTLAGRA